MPNLYNVRVFKRDATNIYIAGNDTSGNFVIYLTQDLGGNFTFIKSVPCNGYQVRGFGVYPGDTISADKFFIYAHKDANRPIIAMFDISSQNYETVWTYVYETSAIAYWSAFKLSSNNVLWALLTTNRGSIWYRVYPLPNKERTFLNTSYSWVVMCPQILQINNGYFLISASDSYALSVAVYDENLPITTSNFASSGNDKRIIIAGQRSDSLILVMYVIGSSRGVYYSTNLGYNWTSLSGTLTGTPISATCVNDVFYYATSEGGLYRLDINTSNNTYTVTTIATGFNPYLLDMVVI